MANVLRQTGHMAGGGEHKEDTKWMDGRIAQFLKSQSAPLEIESLTQLIQDSISFTDDDTDTKTP